MANTSLINDIVLPGSMVEFRNNTVITNALKPQYNSSYEAFGAKPGETINLRTHQEFSVREDSLNIDLQDVEQKSVALARTKIFGIDFAYTDAELAHDVDGFMEFRAKPAMATLAAKVDSYVYNTIADGVSQAVTLPATSVDATDILNAGVKLDNASVPRNDRTVILSPQGHADLVQNSSGLFNNPQKISQQYDDGLVKLPSYGFNFGMSQNVSTHTKGTEDNAYDVKTAPSNGATVLDIDTGTGTMLKGDIFTISSVNAVDKLTKEDLGYLQQFVVTADNTTGGDTTINISPPIYFEGQYQNVTAQPAVNADLVFMGASGAAYRQALAFTPQVGAVSFVDLEMPKGNYGEMSRKAEDGISMSCCTFWDGNTRTQKIRFDILMGAVAVEPTAGCRIWEPQT